MKQTKTTWIVTISLMLGLTLLDQVTKIWAVANLAKGSEINLIGDFLTLQLVYNSGAAFSVGNNFTWVFTLISAVVVLILPVYMYRQENKYVLYVLAVIWAGAVGNLLDRLLREPGFPVGHVVDFIGYYHWFVGNVADIYLVLGVLALLGLQWRETDE